MNPTITTRSGLYFNFINPDPDTIIIEDIAHALANICRFTGHTKQFYSVAQHSVLVSEIVEPEYQLDGLMHDAAEAYIGDISSPLKRRIPQYAAIERTVEYAVRYKFGLMLDLTPAIKKADYVLLATERRDLMAEHDEYWGLLDGVQPLPDRIEPWGPERAKEEFLDRFQMLSALR